MDFSGLENLKIPIVILDKDLNVIFANTEAKKLNQKSERSKCYQLLFGFEKPCWEIPGYRCPLKEIEERKTDEAITINEYPYKGKLRKFLIETHKLKNGLYAELLLDYGEIELYEEEKNPYKVSKNRLIKLVQEYLNRGIVFTISLLNIKKLKVINQFFGLEVRDAVIKTIEKVLDKYSLKYGFYFAEMSGGYFMLVNSIQQEITYAIEKEIFREIDNLQKLFNLPVRPRVSIVSAEISPILTDKAEDVFKILFFAEKNKGGNEHILYLDVEKLNQILTTLGLKRKVVATLEDILKNHNIEVFFQPIVNLRSGKVEHLETLMRIKQNGNYIPIGKYIDLIYELNLITDFDFLVLEKLKQNLPHLKQICCGIFINVSSVDLKNITYQEKLLETVELFKNNGIKLNLEITEQVLFDELEFLKFLHDTKKLKFAIDDFGTGYSSLKLVIDLISQGVIEALKLDCSLIKSYFENKEAQAIINSVVGFTKMLGLETVAECVETEKQAEALREIGVTHGQGWYFYKPMPIDELPKVLSCGI